MFTYIKFTCYMSSMIILCTPHSYAMDLRHRVGRTTQDVMVSIATKRVTPLSLLAKPWVQRTLVYMSMIANACRCCQPEDDIDIDVIEQPSSLQVPHRPIPVHNTPPVPQQAQNPIAQPASSIPLSEIFRDDAAIEQYYGKSNSYLKIHLQKLPKKQKMW